MKKSFLVTLFAVLFVSSAAVAQNASSSYYVLGNGESAGPYNTNELKEMIQTNQMGKTSLVWKSDMAGWAEAGTVSELASLFDGNVSSSPYYVLVNGESAGPYNTNELKEMIQTNRMGKTSLVWKSDMAGWAEAGTVSELASLFDGNASSSPYYVLVNGASAGPYNTNELKAMIQTNQMDKTSLVWKNGMASWAEAGTVNELASLFNGNASSSPAEAGTVSEVSSPVTGNTAESALEGQAFVNKILARAVAGNGKPNLNAVSKMNNKMDVFIEKGMEPLWEQVETAYGIKTDLEWIVSLTRDEIIDRAGPKLDKNFAVLFITSKSPAMDALVSESKEELVPCEDPLNALKK